MVDEDSAGVRSFLRERENLLVASVACCRSEGARWSEPMMSDTKELAE